jgi:GT2 family glycosyltransferase
MCIHLDNYARTWRGKGLGLSFASRSKGRCYTSPPVHAAVTKPAVSIVIVCYNSAAYLPRCLKALAAQSFTDFEIIVIDNASPEGELGPLHETWRDLPIRCERLASNVGFAAANNLGARMAKAPWLALLNPDAFPEPGWLEELLQAAKTHPSAFLASRQIQADHPTLLDGDGDVYFVSGLAQRRNFNVPYYPPGPPQEVFSACAAAALYPRQQFLEVGGFDEDYFAYHEDVDLGFRLRLRGFHCYLIPSAVVYHLGGGSSSRRSALATYYGHRNLVWTYVKDMPSPWFWIYLPLHIAWSVIAIIYFALRGQGGAILRAKLDAIRGIGAVLKKRRLVQSGLRVEPGEVMRFMNRNPIGPLEGIIDRTWPAEG